MSLDVGALHNLHFFISALSKDFFSKGNVREPNEGEDDSKIAHNLMIHRFSPTVTPCYRLGANCSNSWGCEKRKSGADFSKTARV